MVDPRAVATDRDGDGPGFGWPDRARPRLHGSTVARLLRQLQAGGFSEGQKTQQTPDFIDGAGGRD